jgi:beta-fructofuranosidase
MWECPDFFPLGRKHVLLISTKGKVLWKVGTYKDQRFSPEKEGVVDWGSYYAAKTMLDRHGNRILWGWIPETRPEAEFSAAGWAGVMALPRVVSLTAENELRMKVAPEVESLRVRNHHALMNPTSRERSLAVMRIRDLSAEMLMTLNPGHPCSLRLHSDNGETFATIRLTNASGKRQLQINDVKAPLAGSSDAPVRLRIFLDGSVMEAFADGTTVITARNYRAPAGPLRLEFENPSALADVRVWQLQPISKDRMTGSLCD